MDQNFPDPKYLLSSLLRCTFLGPVREYYHQVGLIGVGSSCNQTTWGENVFSVRNH